MSDSWAGTVTTNAPSARDFHTAVWTGCEMIVWGGEYYDGVFHYLNTGGRYDPVTNSWTATTMTNAPDARTDHTAVWTGGEMIVWGGSPDGYQVSFNTGGRYDPVTNSWTATTMTNAPDARAGHRAVWTGSEMIVWGGSSAPQLPPGAPLDTGGRYCAGVGSALTPRPFQ